MKATCRWRALCWYGAVAIALSGCADQVKREDAAAFALAAERSVGAFEASAETRRLLHDASDAFWHLDAAALHAALPDQGDPAGARFALFRGEQKPAGRFVRHEIPSGSGFFEPGITPLLPAGPEPGDGWLFTGAMPLANSPGDYRLRVTSTLSTGRADSFALWRSVPHVLRLLETAPSKSGEDPVIAYFRRRLPRTAELALRYLDFRRSVSWSAERRRSDVELELRARFSALAADYPGFARYLSRLAGSVRGWGSLENEGGAAVASWRQRGPEDGLAVRCGLHDGGLLAANGQGPPLDPLSPLRMRIVSSSSFQLYGVKSTVEGVRATLETDPLGATQTVRLDANGEPERIAIEGRLFGIVPVELLDALVPGTLEDSTRKILATMLRGREGRGIQMATALRIDPPGTHLTTSTVLADIPAGRLARIGLRLFADMIQPDEKEWEDLVRFVRDVLGRMREDLPASSSTESTG